MTTTIEPRGGDAEPTADAAARGGRSDPAPEAAAALVARLRATYAAGRTRPLSWRQEQLAALRALLVEREDRFAEAMARDLGRAPFEGWLADLQPTLIEVDDARAHLPRWARPHRVRVPLAVAPARAWYQYEPLGVALIVGPWNYPVYLTLGPLVAAIAAGDCAILKPSEHAPAVARVLAEGVRDYLDPDAFAVVEGTGEQTQELLDQGLDYCFFTGGPENGKAVMAGAARHLTPVTLELGGKCPVIVAADADVATAARRVAWGKLMNSGQTCVAPDYVLVDRSVRAEFLTALTAAIERFAPGADLPLVNARHAARIAELLAGSGGQTTLGGRIEIETHRAEPTIVLDPDDDSALMREEIFGPVLPVVTVDSLDAAIAHVNDRPKPLAVYLFSAGADTQDRVLAEISNGGTVINHVIYHLLVPGLPFGGVGTSGMGAYHGEFGFQTFSHRKAVLRKPNRPDPWFAYPPYGRLKRGLLRRVM